jgi:hypothetical protein
MLLGAEKVARYTRPARLLCVSGRYDYAMWEVGGDPLPDGLAIPPTSRDLTGPLYIFHHRLPPRFHRAFFQDWEGVFAGSGAPWRGWLRLRLEQIRGAPGWSGSPVFNQRGETMGIVVGGGTGAEATAVMTVPSWWTCDGR